MHNTIQKYISTFLDIIIIVRWRYTNLDTEMTVSRTALCKSDTRKLSSEVNNVPLISTSYRINLIDVSSGSMLLQTTSPRLLTYIDLPTIINSPLLYIESAIFPSITTNIFGEEGVVQLLVKGLQLIDQYDFKQTKADSLLTITGTSNSRFPIEGALLQVYHILNLFLSIKYLKKMWIVISSPLRLANEVSQRISEILTPYLNSLTIIPNRINTFSGVNIRVYLHVSDIKKVLTFIHDSENNDDSLYNCELNDFIEAPLHFDLPLSLIKEI